MAKGKMKRKAFTLIELVVAIAILAMVLSFAGVIFKVSIGAFRTGIANAEIMRKMRAITDQLNTDFKGIRTDAPLFIWFFQDKTDPNQRYDQIMFFADGDFQSTQLYDGNPAIPASTGKPVVGNVSRIYYGQAQSLDSRDNTVKDPFYLGEEDRLLGRRQHMLTADRSLDYWPDAGDIVASFDREVDGYKNELYEHDCLSLSVWKTLDRNAYGAFGGKILNTCFEFRPEIDMGVPGTFHKLMCEGVGNLAIQWAYWEPTYNKFHWFPSDDPDGSGMYSHFVLMDYLPIKRAYWEADFDAFGAFFNIPTDDQINYWAPMSFMKYSSSNNFLARFYPKALKFTFTLYDSMGIIEDGRRFTHIVYIGD